MRASLVVDEEVGEPVLLTRTTPLRFTLHGEGLTCGYTDGTPVSEEYAAPFTYPGAIHEAFVDTSGAVLASAVRDVTACASSGARASGGGETRLVTFDLLPTPGLRVAYSTGFTNGVGGDGLRVLPSLEWLAARVRLSGPGARAYVGLQGTLLDPVAPLAELAMRRADLVFDNRGLAWLDVLRPRLEIAFGVPAFGDHVLLTAGASLRAAAPFFGGKTFNPLAPPQTDRMIYLTPFHADPRARDDFGRFVEVGAGARYVF